MIRVNTAPTRKTVEIPQMYPLDITFTFNHLRIRFIFVDPSSKRSERVLHGNADGCDQVLLVALIQFHQRWEPNPIPDQSSCLQPKYNYKYAIWRTENTRKRVKCGQLPQSRQPSLE